MQMGLERPIQLKGSGMSMEEAQSRRVKRMAEREATNNIIGGSTNDVERRQALDSGVQHWEREDAGYLMREVHQ